jgi:hypothetical protein
MLGSLLQQSRHACMSQDPSTIPFPMPAFVGHIRRLVELGGLITADYSRNLVERY